MEVSLNAVGDTATFLHRVAASAAQSGSDKQMQNGVKQFCTHCTNCTHMVAIKFQSR